jgi:hypothetical protein
MLRTATPPLPLLLGLGAVVGCVLGLGMEKQARSLKGQQQQSKLDL